MSYTDRLLSTGERIVRRDRQHWFVVLWNARYALAAIVLALVVLGIQVAATFTGPLADVLGVLVAITFVAGLAFLVWEVLRYLNQDYIITNRRVIQVSGVINKRSGDSSLEKINDADLAQSIFGRMFDFGDLDILTASDAGIDRLRMIRDPVGYKRAMLDAKHEYERDMSRGAGPASPPLRAAPVEHDRDPTSAVVLPELTPAPAQASGAPAMASPAPAGGSRPNMSPDEVMRTLATLADLRDRGAISAEDYEGKKSELLGRL